MPENIVVVSDSSPLINLFLIDCFALLKMFYKRIVVPRAVWRELTETTKAGVDNFRQEEENGFIIVEDASPSPFLSLLYRDLDFGEAEAISLSLGRGLYLKVMKIIC